MRCNSRDVDEGADILMVKPAGAYLGKVDNTFLLIVLFP
jgi:delta-aminolevulinic acid dehydratase/porphobilinogen synthase